MTTDIRTLVEDMAYLECPRWHDGRLWFSDFYTYAVYSVAADGSDLRTEVEVPEQPSGLGWLPDGRLLIVSMKDARLLRVESDGSLGVHAELGDVVGGHPNDMVVDGQGRAFVGEFGFDLMGGDDPVPAKVLRVDPDGSVHVAAEDMRFPNGMVITDDGTLLVNETFGNRVTAFDVGADGTLGNRRVWAEFGPVPDGRTLEEAIGQVVVGPDGCGLDADGGLWIADAVGGKVIRVLEGGRIDRTIEPGSGVFACILGGDDGRTLFMCVAPDFHEEARKNAREGRLMAVEVDYAHGGLP